MAASAVERVLLMRILNAVMSAVEIVTLPDYSSLSPPTVSLARSFNFLLGL
jgi:hypothetical protein